jgi:hypothetical protein
VPLRVKTVVTPELRERVRQLFNGEDAALGRGGGAGMSDERMAEVLAAEGFDVGLSALARVRKEMGLVRRGKGDAELWERRRDEGRGG